MNHSELSHMAGAVDDSTINIVEVIIIIIIILIITCDLICETSSFAVFDAATGDIRAYNKNNHI